MSSGPIEFLNDEPLHDSGVSEYGGVAGLIQPADGVGARGGRAGLPGHELTPSEIARVMVRGGSVGGGSSVLRADGSVIVGTGSVGSVTDLVAASGVGLGVVDPVSGRVLDPDASKDVTGDGGTFSDLKP